MNALHLKNIDIFEMKRFICKQTLGKDERIVKDYEIDFYISGTRNMIIDGINIPISSGSMVFKKPGQYVISEGDYDVYVLTLNFCPELKISPDVYRRDRNSKTQPFTSHPLIDNLPTHFHPYRKHDYVRIFEKLCLCTYPMPEIYDEQQILLNELFLLLNADIFHKKSLEHEQHNTTVQKCCKYINENFGQDITLNFLAKFSNLSPNYFLRLFKKETNMTPKEYILHVRLEHAKSLLSGTTLKISAIATECGFNDASYFSLFFKRHFGITPLQYRANN